ncbi:MULTISPECIES: ROK family protein [Clostridium]|uniref:ROK family protein n=1 Tax=Clostridium botulinum TaxID=1491 RepID=A0A6B4JNJ0_CLOBO|nr:MULTISPECIES: ROK family protein [Clostridium]EES49834.1 ROK family protein [Clostridium botulinum E1 str. 'BoNT E Beluga']MBY6761702.1 ROK family protein [Clostridium botulinum]MBY6920689.1 ROK family protein [Clostridium botulinum]MBZ9691814.1 ROK family protein [Clostridium sp. M14]MCR1131562.1 ROK family protein [Clostridium botulinum]
MKYYIGIDIGGTNLRAAILDEECNLVDKLKISNEVEKGPEYNLDKLILEIKERWSDKEIISVGVGCPGPLDIRSGTILVTPNLRTWEYFKLKEYLENKFDLPVFVNNDANVAGYSEAMVGAGKGAESVYYMTLSTGIGGGFIYKGEIVSGFNSIAAEIGNMIINEDTYKHSNMNYGGLEGQCSGVNIARISSEIIGGELTTKDVFEGAEKGNMELQKMLSEWVINVSKAIANIIVTVDPEVIVLGGSVIINNPSYLNKIKEETQKRVFDGIKINIKLAEIGDDTGLIGAGLLGKLK